MKYLLALAIPFLLHTQTTFAQAWDKETKVISVGLAAANYYHVGNTQATLFGPTSSFYNPVTGQLTVEGEFGVHEYVGVGFNTGIGGGAGVLTGYAGSLNVPIGFLANFHFYQLIADKTGKNLHQADLDIFVGASLGTGVGVVFYNSNFLNDQVVPLAYGGLHAGVRWYFSENVGLSGQFGFGKSLIDVGIVIKLD
ncbi:MAG: hypothetical protein ACPG5W_12440 [Flavobacteriales bacterium]